MRFAFFVDEVVKSERRYSRDIVNLNMMFQSCHHGPIHGRLDPLLLRVGTLALQGSQPAGLIT